MLRPNPHPPRFRYTHTAAILHQLVFDARGSTAKNRPTTIQKLIAVNKPAQNPMNITAESAQTKSTSSSLPRSSQTSHIPEELTQVKHELLQAELRHARA